MKQHKVIEAARSVFLRYGYKRVTMLEIAQAAGISRPALYLIYPNKAEIFQAVIKHDANQNLVRIREGVGDLTTATEKLLFAFELWLVKPHEVIMKAPEAEELLFCCNEFSKHVYEEVGIQFESELAKILLPEMKTRDISINVKTTAKILRHSARGLKEVAKSAADLRRMIKSLLTLTLGLSQEKNPSAETSSLQ